MVFRGASVAGVFRWFFLIILEASNLVVGYFSVCLCVCVVIDVISVLNIFMVCAVPFRSNVI